ncbi:EKC/KEOPS complex subunit BUD32 [Fusarium sp. LHS14.1]|nr:EKC/KEOPS complex subunit BUD32 [Fusarium sp. LHS14.1]
MMIEEDKEICMFFVDDSNIWIEAQKFAASGNSHMPKLTDRDRDPRLRINIGKLVKTLLGGRLQGTSYLYGSRPPPNDAVWNTFEKYNFRTKIYNRSRGKEKQVDSAMATDLSHTSTKLSTMADFLPEIKEENKRTVFIAITGDQDMVPPITQALDDGFRVELWAWKSGISSEYRKLANEMALLSINYLEHVFREISFTSYRSTRRSGKVDPSCTLVLYDFSGTEVTDLLDAEAIVCNGLDGWGRLSFITPSNILNEFYVEFPGAKNINDMDRLIDDAKTQFGELWKVMSWPQYADRFNEGLPAMVETSNMFAPLEGDGDPKSREIMAKEEPQRTQHSTNAPSATSNVRDPSNPWKLPTGVNQSGNAEASSLNDHTSDTDGWETVTRSNLKSGHHAKQRCPYGIRCGKSGDCGHLHTKEERDLFQALPDQNFKRWKTSKCRHGDRCYLGKRCAYYHTSSEAWCTLCHVEGHSREDCKY